MSASSIQATDRASISARDFALLIAMNLIWGLNLVAAKIGVIQFPPIFFTALRFGLLAVFLLPFLKLHRGQMKQLLAAAMLTGPVAFALLFTGLSMVEDASTVAIVTQLSVPITTLLGVWLLGETIRWRRRLGIALAFGGVAIISFDPHVFAAWDGVAMVVLCCFFGSLGLVYIKRLHGVGPLELQAWIAVVGGPVLMLMSLGLESGQWEAIQNANIHGWSALAFTTLASSLFAHTIWYYLVSRYPVTSVAPVTLLSPVFSVFFGVTLLDDQLTVRMLLGGAVTLIGVLIVVLREQRLVDTGT